MSEHWLPGSRTGQLAMAKVWAVVLDAKTTAWNIPAAQVTTLDDLISAAEDGLNKVQNAATRTHVDTVNCTAVFAALTEDMRFLKNNYFNSPPRTDADLALLELTPHDRNPTDVPPPENVVTGKTRPQANGLIEVVMEIVGEMIKDAKASDYGFRISVGVEDPAAATANTLGKYGRYLSGPPVNGLELGWSVFTRKKREVLEFDEQDRGKKVWFAIQLENAKGQAGPWGPLFWTVIP
jgi:hypothetical protein